MALQYKTPTVEPAWAAARETHLAVATAIHAIAGSHHSADAIWAAPTAAEEDHVRMAVQNYIDTGLFEPEPDGRYSWGNTCVVLEA